MGHPLSKLVTNLLGALTQSKITIDLISHLNPQVKYAGDTAQPVVALTIDDGPDCKTTPQILATLQKYDAKATFFIITQHIQGCEPILQTLTAQGHELGNHLTEDSPSILLSDDEFEADLLKAHAQLQPFAIATWLRPASGWYRPSMIRLAQKHGYQVALGSIFPFDTFLIDSDFAADYILTKITPGAIIVLHDTGAWGQATAKTLETILPKLSQAGYQVVTLSQLFSKTP